MSKQPNRRRFVKLAGATGAAIPLASLVGCDSNPGKKDNPPSEEGKYTDAYLKNEGANAPKFNDEELKIIATPMGFVGLNIYRPSSFVVAADNERGYFEVQLQRATAENVPVKGYFLWSTVDNFEWMYGYGNHFGLVYVDYKTQKRTPKMSATYFREVAKSNKVV